MLSIVVLFAFAAAAQAWEIELAQCYGIYSDFEKKLNDEKTWAVSPEDTLTQLNTVIKAKLDGINKEVKEEMLLQQADILKLISPTSEGSALATDSIQKATTAALATVDDMFQNIGFNIAQSYHDPVYDFYTQTKHTQKEIDDPMMLAQHIIKTDFERLCKQGITNVNTTFYAYKNRNHRVLHTMNKSPVEIPNVPNSYVPLMRPYLLDTFFHGHEWLQSQSQLEKFAPQVISNSTIALNEIAEKASTLLSSINTPVLLYLKKLAVSKPSKNDLIALTQEKVSNSQTEIAEWNVKAQADVRDAIGNPDNAKGPHWRWSTFAQETVNGFVDKLNDLLYQILSDQVNLYEDEAGIAI